MTSPEPSGTPRNVDESYPNLHAQPFIANDVLEQGLAEPILTKSAGLTADQRNPSVPPQFHPLEPTQPMSIGLPHEDMTLIMFPSGDPLAYPAQPMSTLEDGYSKRDGPEVLESFPFEPSASGTLPSPASLRLSTPNRDAFMASPLYTNGSPGAPASALPAHFQHPNVYQSRYSPTQKQSPSSHCSTPGGGEMVNSPDLVSIPSQNFMWQGLGLQPPIGQQPPPQPPSDPIDGQFDDLSMDGFPPIATTMDMKMNLDLDDVLGNENLYFRGSGFGDDMWSNLKSEDDIMYAENNNHYP